MTYNLIQLAPGAYDLLRSGEIVGSVVRTGTGSKNTSWTAELLEDLPRNKRPAPCKEIEHTFPSLEDLRAWLGDPKVRANTPHGDAWAY